MRRISLTLLLLLSLLLVPAAAFAQEDECLGPIDPESELIVGSREAMAGLTSYASSAWFVVTLDDAPGLPRELAFTMAIDGEFEMDEQVAQGFLAFQEMDPAEMAANVEEMMDLVVALYQTMAFNMDMDLGFSADLANLIAASSGMPSGSIPSSILLPTRMVDGFLYFNIDDLAASFDAPEGVEGWIGMDYGTLIAESMEQAMAGDTAATGFDSMATSMGAGFALQNAIKNYTSIEGLGISEVDGEEVCELHYTYDLAGFLSDPAFISMLTDQMRMQLEMQEEMGAEESSLTEADIDMIADMAPMLAPMLFSGLQGGTIASIGVEDGYVRVSDTQVEWDLGSIFMMAAALMEPGSQPAPVSGAPVFFMGIAQENSSFGEPVVVEVPEPVQIIPLDQLTQAE